MANKTIDDFTENTSPASTDLVLVDEGSGVFKSVPLLNLSAGAIGTQTFSIGSAGDFATVTAALDYLATKGPAAPDTVITLNILTGETFSEQVSVKGHNFGWVELTSDDAVVTIDRSALTQSYATSEIPAFYATAGGVLPIIKTQFNMDTSGTSTNRTGIQVIYGAKVISEYASSCGVTNAATYGLYVGYGATAEMDGSDFSGAGTDCVLCYAAYASLETATLDSAGSYGIWCSGGRVFAGGSDTTSAGLDGYGVENGGIIQLSGGETGTLSETKNTVTGNGLIMQT